MVELFHFDLFVNDRVVSQYHDEASRFVHLLTSLNPTGGGGGGGAPAPQTDNNSNALGGRTCLVPEDFVPLVQDVVDTHPGLTFLKEATEFHSRYVHTVFIYCSSIYSLVYRQIGTCDGLEHKDGCHYYFYPIYW